MRFSRDEDYVEIDESPSKFESTDEEEDMKFIEDETNRNEIPEKLNSDLPRSEKYNVRRSPNRFN